MTKTAIIFRALVAVAVFAAGNVSAAGAGIEMESAQIDLGNKGSLQRGAGLYMSYCSACHSLGYMRYSRMAEDLGLTEEEVTKNLMFTDAKFGESMNTGLDPKQATAWFGKAPPDLSLIARSRGTDYLYQFLKSFYADPATASGVNNLSLPGTAMWARAVRKPCAP